MKTRRGTFRHQRLCEIEGCDRDHRARGLCRRHYTAARRAGEFGAELCSILGCPSKADARELCHKHWTRWNRGRQLSLFDTERISWVRVEPIGAFIEQLTLRYELEVVSLRTGVPIGTLEQYRARRFARMKLDTADRILTAFDGDPSLLEVA